MVATHILSGKKGEDEACSYLKKHGYKLLARNFRTRNGEIDIIAVKNNCLVFVEVKTRSSNVFGTPFEAITSWKIEALRRTAEFYKATHKGLPDLMRIDAISVLEQNGEIEVEHMQNVS